MSEGNPWPTTRWDVSGGTRGTFVFVPGYLQVVGRARMVYIRLCVTSTAVKNKWFRRGLTPLNMLDLDTGRDAFALAFITNGNSRSSLAQVGGRLLQRFIRNNL